MGWSEDPCFCTRWKAEIMRILLSFYRPQNASQKPKLWSFEKFACNFGTFPDRPLRIVVGSYRMILTPMFLYSSESWEPEVYFKLWESSKRFQKTWDMTIWKLTKILALFRHFVPSPIFCIWFRRPSSLRSSGLKMLDVKSFTSFQEILRVRLARLAQASKNEAIKSRTGFWFSKDTFSSRPPLS